MGYVEGYVRAAEDVRQRSTQKQIDFLSIVLRMLENDRPEDAETAIRDMLDTLYLS